MATTESLQRGFYKYRTVPHGYTGHSLVNDDFKTIRRLSRKFDYGLSI